MEHSKRSALTSGRAMKAASCTRFAGSAPDSGSAMYGEGLPGVHWRVYEGIAPTETGDSRVRHDPASTASNTKADVVTQPIS